MRRGSGRFDEQGKSVDAIGILTLHDHPPHSWRLGLLALAALECAADDVFRQDGCCSESGLIDLE